MSNLLKLARKFELKLLAHDENYAVEYLEKFKTDSKSNLNKIISQLAKIIVEGTEFREIANFAHDPLAKFGDRAISAINNVIKIREKILQLNVQKEDLSIEKIASLLFDILQLISDEVKAHGSDKWGIMRDKFLNLLEVYGDFYTTQGGYGDPSVLNDRAKTAIEDKLGRLTHIIDTIKNKLLNKQNTGALDILKKLSTHGLIDSTRIDNLIQNLKDKDIDTSRVTRNLQEHEKINLIHIICNYIGLGGADALNEWNEFIKPYPDMIKIATSIWFTAQFKTLWGKLPKSTLEKVVQEEPSILPKLQILKAHIVPLVKKSKEEQKNKEEKAVGRIPIPSPILPKKNERELISGLSAGERRIWSTLTQEEKKEILSGNKDLDDVLEEQQRKLGL